MRAHPLADLFPLMTGADYEALRDDIKVHGQREPVWVYQDLLLDGRNRERACRELSMKCAARDFDPARHGDPLAFVISMNLKRRHLDESQRGMVAAKLEQLEHGGDRKSDQSANLHLDRAKAAELLNVSIRTVASAAKVRDHGVPELVEAAEQGRLAVSVAAQATTLSPELQREIAGKADGKAATARNVVKKEARAEREKALGAEIRALPTKRYGVILADPEWRFETWSERGKDMTSPENHYPTSPTEVIAARDVPSICAEDCVLFLWATAPMIEAALVVMRAWGFAYKKQAIWRKDREGTGYWFRNEHELLLVGVRGHVPAPAPGTQWSSVIEGPRGEHSAKPDKSLELIEAYFPTLPKIELNRRGPARPGWDAWGNEAETAGVPLVPESIEPSVSRETTGRNPTHDLFVRGKEVFGFAGTGLVARALMAKAQNVAAVRDMVELAAHAEKPRDFIEQLIAKV